MDGKRRLTLTIQGETNPIGSGKTWLQLTLARLLQSEGHDVTLEDETCSPHVFQTTQKRFSALNPKLEPVSIRLIVSGVLPTAGGKD